MAEQSNGSNVLAADMPAPEAMPVNPEFVQQPVASARYEAPAAPLDAAALKALRKPFELSGPKFITGVIVTLLILVVVMGGFTIYSLTNGPVNVTITVPNSTSSSSSSSGGSTAPIAVGEPNPSTTTTQTDIYVYVIAKASDTTSGKLTLADLPVGAIAIDGTKDFIVPIISTAKYSGTDTLQKALTDLLSYKQETITGTTFHTGFSNAAFTFELTTQADGTSKVNVKGTWPTSTVAGNDAYLKAQIERTIQKYTYSYIVTLNGSETAYKCLGSTDTTCK